MKINLGAEEIETITHQEGVGTVTNLIGLLTHPNDYNRTEGPATGSKKDEAATGFDEEDFQIAYLIIKVVTGCEWLCFHDEMTQEVRHHQYYQLNSYLSYVPVVFHLLFAAPGFPKITYPHRQGEFRQKQQDKAHLLESLLSDIAPSISRFVTRDIMVMDVLTNLLGIIQPSLRPINVQLYSAREREQLSGLVDVMIAYNLTYLQQRAAAGDGQYSYALEPNIEEIARFPLSETRLPSVPLTYAAKQLIAREVELEKMRRSEQQLKEASQKHDTAPARKTATAAAAKPVPAPAASSSPASSSPASQSIPNHKQRLQPINIKEKRDHKNEVSRDFFGRIVQRPQPSLDCSAAADSGPNRNRLLQGDIWFKFKEGFSNAVRKNVRIKDLL